MVKIVDVSDLAGYGYTFAIFCSDGAIVDESVLGVTNQKVFVGLFAILRNLVSLKQKIAANHDTSPPFSGLTMDRGNILFVCVQPVITIDTKPSDHVKWRRVMIIEAVFFSDTIIIEMTPIIFPFRT